MEAIHYRGMMGEGVKRQGEATGNRSNDPQTINSPFPIGISFLKQRSTISFGHRGECRMKRGRGDEQRGGERFSKGGELEVIRLRRVQL